MRVSRQGGGGAQGCLVSLWPLYTHLLPRPTNPCSGSASVLGGLPCGTSSWFIPTRSTPPIPAQAPLMSLEACPVEVHAGNRTSDQIPLAAGLGEWPENTALALSLSLLF